MNTDRLFTVTAADGDKMRNAVYRVIDRSQDDPEVQVQAIAIALYSTCRALGLDIRQLLTSVERMANDLDGPFTSTFRALEAYARNEIGRR
jgi:hypothetical protein